MNKAQLKELVKNIMTEESEYQAFFKKALEKAGKSIPSMSDEEKKAFFDKIDSAWDGKGEKNEGNAFGAAVTAAKKAGEDEFEVGGETYKVEEELVGGQKKLDVDGDGEIESSDLADLRAGKKADEAMELPKATIPSAVKSKLDMAIDKIKDSDLTYNQKVQVVGQVMDSLGIDKAEFSKMTSKLKGTMESVNESLIAKDGKILLNGKPVGYYDYDRDSAAFWTTDLSDKQFRGSKAFDTKEEMLAFFKKYLSRAAKALEYERKALAKFGIKYPADESVNEARLTDIVNSIVETPVIGKMIRTEAKKYDIGSGWMGNGLTIWNRAEEEHGDYKIIAHISPDGKLSIRDKQLPSDIKKMFQTWADTMKKGDRPGIY